MRRVRRIIGKAVSLPRDNIDTDAIIPQRYLVTVDKDGMADGFFGGWRRGDDGSLDPSFPLNRPENAGATILIAGANYGCGSSREHAVWAHLAWGIEAVVAPGFGPIFRGNAARNGLLLIALEPREMAKLLAVRATGSASLTIDIESQTITIGTTALHFAMEPKLKSALIEGTDEIGETLNFEPTIAGFQKADRRARPWVWEGVIGEQRVSGGFAGMCDAASGG